MTEITSYNSHTGDYTVYCQRCEKEIISINGIDMLPLAFVGKFCLECQLDSLEKSKKELKKHMNRLLALLRCVENNTKMLTKIKQEQSDE